jgi:hypothetical protein
LRPGCIAKKKAKKQSRPRGLSWIHSNVPAVYTASESVLWSRKYCLTESGRRGSLFPRRPFATFGPTKVGPRQRLAGDSFQERNQCSPLLFPLRNAYLPRLLAAFPSSTLLYFKIFLSTSRYRRQLPSEWNPGLGKKQTGILANLLY